jgi:hypothetical protein
MTESAARERMAAEKQIGDGQDEPFDAFVRRIAPEHADYILTVIEDREDEIGELRAGLARIPKGTYSIRDGSGEHQRWDGSRWAQR